MKEIEKAQQAASSAWDRALTANKKDDAPTLWEEAQLAIKKHQRAIEKTLDQDKKYLSSSEITDLHKKKKDVEFLLLKAASNKAAAIGAAAWANAKDTKGEKRIKLLEQEVVAFKEYEKAIAALVTSQQAALKTTSDADVKAALEKEIKESQYLQARIATETLTLERNKAGTIFHIAWHKAIAATEEEKIKLCNQAIEASKEYEKAIAALVTSQQAALETAPDADAKAALEKEIKKSKHLQATIPTLTLTLEVSKADVIISVAVNNARAATEEEKIKLCNQAIDASKEYQKAIAALVTSQQAALETAPNADDKAALEKWIKGSQHGQARIAVQTLEMECGKADVITSVAWDKAMAATGEEKIKLYNQAIEASKEQEKATAALVASQQATLETAPDADAKAALEKEIKESQYRQARIATQTLTLEYNKASSICFVSANNMMDAATEEEAIKLGKQFLEALKEKEKAIAALVASQQAALETAPDTDAKAILEKEIKESKRLQANIAIPIMSLVAWLNAMDTSTGEEKIKLLDQALEASK